MIAYICAVCGNGVDEEDCGNCDICGWVGDTLQEIEPDYRGGANKVSLNEARIVWEAKKQQAQLQIPQRAVV